MKSATAAVPTQHTQDLWRLYKKTRSLDVRNQLLMRYLGLVRCIAIKMNAVYRNTAELEDIINEGVLVLMDCIERFDPDRDTKFETYASIRIRGAIIDHIREQDWIPRSVRNKVKKIEDTYTTLQAEKGRPVTDAEVAEALQIDVDDLSRTVGEANAFYLLSYEELLMNNALNSQQSLTDTTVDSSLDEQELKTVIANSIDRLNEKERLVISLYYYEELKLKDIAQILGLTQSRVSQIHANALRKMKHALQKYMME